MKTLQLLAIIITGFFAACNKSEPVGSEQPNSESDGRAAEVHPSLPAGGAVLEGSLHDLDTEWQDQNAVAGLLADHLGGKIQVVSMGYSTCKFACPALIADMRRIRDGIDKGALGSKVGFAFISIDPETDTPARLKEFEKESDFDPKVWTLLRSDADNVLELAVVLGMKYRKTTIDDFAHSNIITVIGPGGAVLHQQEGINADPAKTIATIKATLGWK
jgi:protein SCO1/2